MILIGRCLGSFSPSNAFLSEPQEVPIVSIQGMFRSLRGEGPRFHRMCLVLLDGKCPVGQVISMSSRLSSCSLISLRVSLNCASYQAILRKRSTSTGVRWMLRRSRSPLRGPSHRAFCQVVSLTARCGSCVKYDVRHPSMVRPRLSIFPPMHTMLSGKFGSS